MHATSTSPTPREHRATVSSRIKYIDSRQDRENSTRARSLGAPLSGSISGSKTVLLCSFFFVT